MIEGDSPLIIRGDMMFHAEIPVCVKARTIKKIVKAIESLPEFEKQRAKDRLCIDTITEYIINSWIDDRMKAEGKK